MRYMFACLAGGVAVFSIASCGKETAQAPQAPRFVQEREKKVAEFKAQRGLEKKEGESLNDRLAAELRRVRSAIVQYSQSSKSLPWQPGQVQTDQWSPLGFGNLPVNPLSPEKARTRVVEISRKGATGAQADPNEAGWVWNSADGKLFAAGSDE